MKYAIALTLALVPVAAHAEPLTAETVEEYIVGCKETANLRAAALGAFYMAKHNRDYEKAINNIAICMAYTSGRRDGAIEVRDIMAGVK